MDKQQNHYVTSEEGKIIAKDLMNNPLPFNKFTGDDIRTVMQNDKGILVKYGNKPATPDEVKYSLHKQWLAVNPFYPSSQRYVKAALESFAGNITNSGMNKVAKTIKDLYIKTCKTQDNIELASNNQIPFRNMCSSLFKRFNEYVSEKKKAAQIILNTIYGLKPFALSYIMESEEQNKDSLTTVNTSFDEELINECVHKVIQEHIKTKHK